MSERLKLAEYFVTHYGTSAVDAIQQMDAQVAGEFIEGIDDSLSVQALRSMLPASAVSCIDAIPKSSAARYLNQLSTKEAAAILRYASEELRNALMKMLSRRQALGVSIALRFQESLVGAWIDTSTVGLHRDTSAKEARKQLVDRRDVYSHAFVVNGRNEVIGQVSLSELMQADENQPIANLMKSSVQPIYASLTLQQAVELERWGDNDALPVIDRNRKMVGVVRFIDLWRAMLELSPVNSQLSQTHSDVLGVAEMYYLRLADLMDAALSSKHTSN